MEGGKGLIDQGQGEMIFEIEGGNRGNRYISTAYTTSVQFHRYAIYQQLCQILEISNNNKGKQKILESRNKPYNQQCEVSLRLGEETQQKRWPNLSSFSNM